jgi:hypothetical protein
LTKKLNDFSAVIFDTGMTARSTSLAAAMIRGASRLNPAGFAVSISFNLSL